MVQQSEKREKGPIRKLYSMPVQQFYNLRY